MHIVCTFQSYSVPNSVNKHWIAHKQGDGIMKKLITTIVITSSLLMAAQALRADDDDDRAPAPRYNSERIVDRMAERLDLTKEQENTIREIKQEEFDKIRTIREQNRQRIEANLTEQQKQKMRSRDRDCNRDGSRDSYRDGKRDGGGKR